MTIVGHHVVRRCSAATTTGPITVVVAGDMRMVGVEDLGTTSAGNGPMSHVTMYHRVTMDHHGIACNHVTMDHHGITCTLVIMGHHVSNREIPAGL
jgi:hypothetical protein